MYVRDGFVRIAFLATLAVCLLVMFTEYIPVTHAEEKKDGGKEKTTVLPKGARPATKDDLEWMKWTGIPNPKEGMTVNPDDPFIGKAAGETKQWLAKHATKGVNITCLNPRFADKLKKFMEAAGAATGNIPTITDGYRAPHKQTALVASGASRAGPCQSYHNYGQAADFNQNRGGQTPWMRANSRQYGIGIIGSWDPNHFQDANGRTGQCGACGNDSGNGTLPPASGSPSNNFANTIRQALGMQQQPAAQPQPQLPPQPLQQMQPLIQAFQEPVSQKIEPTSATPTQASSSVADKLEGLAFGEKQTSPATTTHATSIPVYLDGSDIGGIASKGKPDAPQPVTATAGIGGSVTQSTFGSENLIWENSQTDITGFQAILLSIQQRLQAILVYLTPFSRRIPAHSGHPDEAYLE